MDAKMLILDILEELVEKELKEFTWQLWNGVTPNVNPIPRGKLQKADCQDVVDCMVQYYGENAGMIAVEALRKSKQNERAKRLESKLQKGQQPMHGEESNAAASEELKPIQSDWQRPMVTPCSQELKMRILHDNRNEIYRTVNRPQRKGLALVITNINFTYGKNRHGAEKDEENMEWLLTALGYGVEKYRDLTAHDINKKVKDFSKHPEHRESDSTFVVIMSHGKRINNKDAILGINYDLERNPNDVYFVEDTFEHLNSQNCPALIDKPKVILIQACRGKQPGGVDLSEQDPESDAWVHKEKDFVCFMSSLPDIYAYRDPQTGSFFICYIVDVFCRCACTDHIMDLFMKVASRMANDQRFQNEWRLLPCIERTSLVGKFYLFP